MLDRHRRFIGDLALSFGAETSFSSMQACDQESHYKEAYRPTLIRQDFLLHEEDFGLVTVHGHIDTGAHATGQLTCLDWKRIAGASFDETGDDVW